MIASVAPSVSRRKIVIIEEDDRLGKMLGFNLKMAGYQPRLHHDPENAIARLRTALPDVVLISDLQGELSGPEVTARIRKLPGGLEVPIILLADRPKVRGAVDGLQSGADDYLPKPISMRELLARINAQLRRVDLSLLQPLSRLPGNVLIEREIRRRMASGDNWAVMYADLDNFKAYNDRYGFARGDEVIKYGAVEIIRSVEIAGGDVDFVGHVGGDDFVVVTEPQYTKMIGQTLINFFDSGIQRFYSEEDRRAGFIKMPDRHGVTRKFPLVSISIAVVSNQSRRIESYNDIGEISAAVKKHAKKIQGSSIVWDTDLL